MSNQLGTNFYYQELDPLTIEPTPEFHQLLDRIIEQQPDIDPIAYVKAYNQHDFETAYQTIQIQKKGTPYFFVTINPRPGTTFEQLHAKITTMVKNPDIKDPYWSYELRKTGDLHAHIYFQVDKYNKNFVQRAIKKHFVPDLCQNKKHVYVKWILKDDIQKVKDYIAKKTVAKSKKEADELTIQWRKSNNILEIYTGDNDTCLSPGEGTEGP